MRRGPPAAARRPTRPGARTLATGILGRDRRLRAASTKNGPPRHTQPIEGEIQSRLYRPILRSPPAAGPFAGTPPGEARIFPRANDEFFWKDVEAQITFVRDDQGRVTGAIHHQGGQTLNAPKLKDEPAAKVDPAPYDAYAGEYKIENIGSLKITRAGNHLYVQVNDQPRFELFPRSPTEFFLKIVQADITFAKDPDGMVTGLTLKQSGLTVTGPKVK